MARIDFEAEERRREAAVGAARAAADVRGAGPAGPVTVLLAEDRRRTVLLAGQVAAYGAFALLVLATAGVKAAAVLALSWGALIAWQALGFWRWRGDHARALAEARAGAALLGALPSSGEAAVAGGLGSDLADLYRRCEAEAGAVRGLLSGTDTDAARAAEAEAAVREGLERVRALLQHRASLEPLLRSTGEEERARERADLRARLDHTADPETREAYEASLAHLDAREGGIEDLRALAERIEAQARAYADALGAMRVDLLRLRTSEAAGEPGSPLGRVAEQAERLSGEVQSVRDLVDETARMRRARETP